MEVDFSSLVSEKRILLVLNGTFSPVGGMYEYAQAWLDLLARNNWQVGFCGSASVTNLQVDELDKYITPSELDGASNYYKALAVTSLFKAGCARRFYQSIFEHISNFQPAIVHISDMALHTGFLLSELSQAFPTIFFICTIHDPKRHEEKISWYRRVLIKINDSRILNAARNVNVFIHVHKYELTKDTPFSNIQRLIEIPHPVPKTICKRQRPWIFERISLSPIRVGFMGRIEPYKGLDVLYNALKELLRDKVIQSDQIEIFIVGQGHFSKENWLSLPIKTEIYNDFVTDQEFHQLMANLDVLVLPYRTATQSGVGMMAVAYGIPIIASNVGALEGDVVKPGQNGILVEANDIHQLAAGLATLIAAPEKLKVIAKFAASNVV